MEKKKQIVFYCATHPIEMVYKMAKVFKRKNYETILITMSEKDRFDHQFYSEVFDRIICSNFQFFKPSIRTTPFYILKRGLNFIKFLISMKFLKPYVIIGIIGTNWQLKFVHKYFFKKYPLIYFPYDIASYFYNSKEEALKYSKSFEIEAEKYLFENSNGIIHKGAPDELKPKNGFIHEESKLSPLQLSFFPYCLKEFSVEINKNKLSKKDKQLHLVYIGSFPDELENKKKLYSFLEETFKQGIHSHFYLKSDHLSHDREKEYIQKLFVSFSGNKLLHLHPKLNPKEIVSEISKYDFGFWLSYGLNVPEVKNCMGNKLSTCLEAGIPLLYDRRLIFVDKLMKSYGLQIYFDESNLSRIKKILGKLNKREINKKIINARQDFDMDKNFPRLEKFIIETVASFNKK